MRTFIVMQSQIEACVGQTGDYRNIAMFTPAEYSAHLPITTNGGAGLDKSRQDLLCAVGPLTYNIDDPLLRLRQSIFRSRKLG